MAGTGILRGISANEEVLVERAIGAAVMDKLRGEPATLSASYKAQGGQDSLSTNALNAIDRYFQSWNISAAERAVAGVVSAPSAAAAFQQWAVDSAEQALVERTIGTAYLRKLSGTNASYTDVYQSLGGSNPQTRRALGEVDPLWARVNIASVNSVLENV
jgi:hypothetical protein